ncbi:MAG: ABC transporter permease [Candidatus Zixiibacteriota bacterium]
MVALSLIKIAFQALLGNKLRSGLTLLGVIIGVTSVMTIISALEGMMQGIEDDLQQLGPSTFVVATLGGVVTSEEQWLEMLKRKALKTESLKYLEEGCDFCEKISARTSSRASVKYRDKGLRRVSVRGASAEIIDIVDIEVGQGRFYSREDELHRRQVAFIGDFIREELFGGLDPIGREIRIGARKYTVIGIAKKLGSTFGENRDNFILIPFSTHLKQFGDQRKGLAFFIKAVSVEKLDEAMDQVRIVLRSRRKVPFDKPDDFSLLTADNLLETLNAVTKMFRFALIGISSVALVVGGIVVMNIMMVSVTERTREIGIRKSVGATQKHILLQFLFEALMTTCGGGFVGILLGFLIARWLVSMIDMQIEPSAFAVMAGLIISTGTGVFFGLYPAMKAARLDPIKALSYE